MSWNSSQYLLRLSRPPEALLLVVQKMLSHLLQKEDVVINDQSLLCIDTCPISSQLYTESPPPPLSQYMVIIAWAYFCRGPLRS